MIPAVALIIQNYRVPLRLFFFFQSTMYLAKWPETTSLGVEPKPVLKEMVPKSWLVDIHQV